MTMNTIIDHHKFISFESSTLNHLLSSYSWSEENKISTQTLEQWLPLKV